jgi:hypothetical protein
MSQILSVNGRGGAGDGSVCPPGCGAALCSMAEITCMNNYTDDLLTEPVEDAAST